MLAFNSQRKMQPSPLYTRKLRLRAFKELQYSTSNVGREGYRSKDTQLHLSFLRYLMVSLTFNLSLLIFHRSSYSLESNMNRILDQIEILTAIHIF